MRIDHLDLIKYGKFTDRRLAFPAAERDFHVIVGPNEAGKSTVRAAVQDLLYGIPARTVHGFIHPMTELRLGALLQHGGTALALHRTKGNKNTLRTPADVPLPEAALSALLGSSDRDFYAQMFGLDHDKLVKGGDSILQASNDLGQILFQSAAGIAGLGELRQQLDAEAGKLWAPRRAADRAYYQAADALDAATAAVKAATVRSRDWADAQTRLAELDTAQRQSRDQLTALRTRRAQLERVRRVLPPLAALQDIGTQLQALAAVVPLPPDAAATLARAETELAMARDAQALHQAQQQAAAQALAGLRLDADALARAADITALNEQRLQYRAHAGDIARRQLEVDALWKQAQDLAAALGWPAAQEDALWPRLPAPPLRRTLERLMREHGALHQAQATAARAEVDKRDELARTQAQLAALPQGEAPLGLQVALQGARQLGDVAQALRERAADVERKSAALEAGAAALGPWRCEVPALRALQLPAADTVEAHLQAQREAAAEARSLNARAASLGEQIAAQTLAVAQYREAHQPVTRDAVLHARAQRQAVWAQIRHASVTLTEAGPVYDTLVQQADHAADARHDTVQQASELQSRQQQLARLQLEADGVQTRLAELATADARHTADWATQIQACGLPGLALSAVTGWAEARRHALAAADALALAEQAQRQAQQAAAAADAALAQQLAALGQSTTDGTLATRLLQAEALLKRLDDAAGQRRTLTQHLADGQAALARHTAAHAAASLALQTWQAAWDQALSQSGLQGDLAEIEAALALIGQLDDARTQMRQIRSDRIATMQADLAGHAQAARQLAAALDANLLERPATEIALQLAERLQQAQQAQAEHQRLQAEHQQAQARAADAQARQRNAQATLQPLLARAGVATPAELAEAIAQSDRQRSLLQHQAQAEALLRDSGDGLSLAQLQAETATINPLALPAELHELQASEATLVDAAQILAVRRSEASAALGRIAGHADAAQAEAQRQEALAQMGEAVQRYLKVQTAARLLKWAIERYREARQGPMLSRASAIFAALTLGSFERLAVDFDAEPLKLQGRRHDGQLVDIGGLSEGTRDQLYLALRLAALHLHLDPAQGDGLGPSASSGHALPFIADDLFINYDDRRASAGLHALGELSRHTQVLFLTHHDHLLPQVREVFGAAVNVVEL